MITKMRGIAHFFYNQMCIHGSLIFMNNAQTSSLSGSFIGGQCLDVHQLFFQQKPKKVGIVGYTQT